MRLIVEHIHSDLVRAAEWKRSGPRTRQLRGQNESRAVKEISSLSFSAQNELVRIKALLLLKGVAWPMASVILHFTFEDEYPMLDRRAMRAVGGSESRSFERWMEYAGLCRNKARECGITMRQLDRALWVHGGKK